MRRDRSLLRCCVTRAAPPRRNHCAVTLADVDAGTFYEWLEDFVIKGNDAADVEKHGTLEYRSPAQGAYFTLTFRNQGIFKMTRLPAAAGCVRRVRARSSAGDGRQCHIRPRRAGSGSRTRRQVWSRGW
jgi:hypothetical protein